MMIGKKALGIGDRVLVDPPPDEIGSPKEFVNCAGIPYAGLTGTIIAKARNITPPLDLWLVLFDRDICGLNIPDGCDHDFVRQAREDEKASFYAMVDGEIAKGRNQRFFYTAFLKRFGDAATVLEPRNNDGRSTCFWCGAPTRSVPGISVNNYDICTGCGK
jgi:hypothetical protein